MITILVLYLLFFIDMMYAESVSAVNTPQIGWKTSSYPEFLVHQQQQQRWYLPGQQYQNPPVPVNQVDKDSYFISCYIAPD